MWAVELGDVGGSVQGLEFTNMNGLDDPSIPESTLFLARGPQRRVPHC